MPLGRSIRIYLSDGSVAGIRHGEIVNWTGQAISCPRARFPELRDWPEAPGIEEAPNSEKMEALNSFTWRCLWTL